MSPLQRRSSGARAGAAEAPRRAGSARAAAGDSSRPAANRRSQSAVSGRGSARGGRGGGGSRNGRGGRGQKSNATTMVVLSILAVVVLVGGILGYKYATGNQTYYNNATLVFKDLKPRGDGKPDPEAAADFKNRVDGLSTTWVTDSDLIQLHTQLQKLAALVEKSAASPAGTKGPEVAMEAFAVMVELAAVAQKVDAKYKH